MRLLLSSAALFHQLNLHQEGPFSLEVWGDLFLFVFPPISLFVTTSQYPQRMCKESLSSHTLRLGEETHVQEIMTCTIKFLHQLQDSGVQLFTIISSALISTIKSGFAQFHVYLLLPFPSISRTAKIKEDGFKAAHPC